ncbi:MAG: type IV pilus assembly protein PilM [Candidatus Moranbacteria bacterium]|nr:type IV pilus assembly protein PilM [Candidatus Moranbacteria bacterium]OIQ02398.1 MAG: hypothetical protein AUK58_03270 [Candidatus Moranbacteria bacterium CG2_30_41_165]PIP26003.1 MAG: hypothetical protein COX32_00365 [Candidatus Moranbacteria bacterium CG23_combo_of_CG06-09_8_20_14_all_41_28]PIV86649.1 MAG: hypothetical protein COW50_00200 [Candidatus Moranbacteria bacterium CG17_big_fil_post_rev_8_21_14_2_50_41_107]PIW93908.1 MAG: hypothetical protein COZ86_03890 [Candidatus Moranbacteri
MAFSFRTPHFLGIDFGAAHIKAVEIALENDQPVLVNYSQIDLTDLERKKVSEPNYSYDDAIVSYLQELIDQMKPKSELVSVAMPAFTGLAFFVDFPVMEDEELSNALHLEAHKYIPSTLEDVTLSWEVVDRHGTPDGEMMGILLVAALNKDILRFKKYIERTSLNLGLLELEIFSLTRAIIGDELGLYVIIDIGLQATNILLVENGIIKASRNVGVGGKDITHTIKESFGVADERAEEMKKSGKNFFTSAESTLSFPSLQSVASEVVRILSSYQSENGDTVCKQIFLSGGSAHFTGLAEYYTKILNINVSIADPWKNISHKPELESRIREFGASFSVAIGLALYGIETHLHKKVSLVKEKKTFKDFFIKKI